MKLRNQDPKRRRRSSKGNALMMLVCAYVIYLGVNLLRNYATQPDSEASGWVQLLFGILFLVVGAGFLVWYFLQYRRAKEEEENQEPVQDQEQNGNPVQEEKQKKEENKQNL